MLPSSLEICLKKILGRVEDFVLPGEHCGVSSVFTFSFFFFLSKVAQSQFLLTFPHPQTSFYESKKRGEICGFQLKFIHACTALLWVLNIIVSVLCHQHSSF